MKSIPLGLVDVVSFKDYAQTRSYYKLAVVSEHGRR